MRILLHYLGMMVVIPVYGIQVCPFLDEINPIIPDVSIGRGIDELYF